MNERITENLFKDILQQHGYFAEDSGIYIEEQASDNKRIQRCLKTASKSGKGVGRPEFLITAAERRDVIVVVECKASVHDHESVDQVSNPAKYAVDGALHYAKHLKKEYTVIAIGVSGQTATDLQVSVFVWRKNSESFERPKLQQIVPLHELIERSVDLVAYSPESLHSLHREVKKLSASLNKDLHRAKVPVAQRAAFVSGILLALSDRAFPRIYQEFKGTQLAKQTVEAIRRRLDLADLDKTKQKILANEYQRILSDNTSLNETSGTKTSPLSKAIQEIDFYIKPIFKAKLQIDVLGAMYTEFLQYVAGNGKDLGIVLTPTSTTELFCELAELTKDSVVVDPCLGTGGFLVTALTYMLRLAETDADRKQICHNSFHGAELDKSMYTLAVANMLLRGDGHSQLHQMSCFDTSFVEAASGKATVGMINPPYALEEKELMFVDHMLDLLQTDGIGIAIVPMSCALHKTKDKQNNLLRKSLLDKHRLLATLSMPDTLFHGSAGVITAVLVFQAHRPNSNFKSWFGYCKSDGFEVKRHAGRVERNWEIVKKNWISAYQDRKEFKRGSHPVPELADFGSVLQNVTADDDWCAEAYLEPDYAKLSEKEFQQQLLELLKFEVTR